MKKNHKRSKYFDSFGQPKNDDFDFELIEKYYHKKDHSSDLQTLSHKTCNDLDFQELFMILDRTSSKPGQQYFYNKLRSIPPNADTVSRDEKIIEHFLTDADFRTSTQKLLKKLNKEEAYYISTLFQDEHLKPPKWFFIVPILSFTSLLSLVMLLSSASYIILFLAVFIGNIAIHYWNKKNLYSYLNSLPQLLRINNIAAKLFNEVRFKDINPQLPNSIKIINQVRNRMSFFQLEAKIQGDLESAFWSILETFKVVFLLEPLLLFGVLKRLDTKRNDIHTVFSFVGQIDALLSIASLRKSSNLHCTPLINENVNRILAQEMYHPLIKDCVPNSIEVDKKSALLTGSNMSGKTSFIRTVGINIITGLTLNTCFAKSITIPRTRVYSAIRISDDLMNDRSYYFEEVLTIKKMIDNSKNNMPNLLLLDEIFKGTNTVERISAGKAVLSALARNNNIVFVSTHDIELADMLSNQYDLYHFSEIIDHKNIDFDYKLKVGKLKNRNAIRILQINDYPAAIIDEAMRIAKQLDTINEHTGTI